MFLNINTTVILDKNRTMDNVQKHNICINVPSSQTFRSHCVYLLKQASEMQTLVSTGSSHLHVHKLKPTEHT
jgi:hypothetical protein